jgi:hypothetical protein
VARALGTRDLEDLIHQRAPDPAAAFVRDHVQLRQVALERLDPDRPAKAQDGDAVRLVPRQEDDRVSSREQLTDPRRDLLRARREVLVLGVEVVQERADRVCVGGLRPADHGYL